MENKLEIPKSITINSLETIKILSDPTRLEIMKYVGEKNKWSCIDNNDHFMLPNLCAVLERRS